MARKMIVEVKIKLTILAEDGVELSKIMDEMDYDFKSCDDGVAIADTELMDYELIDSK